VKKMSNESIPEEQIQTQEIGEKQTEQAAKETADWLKQEQAAIEADKPDGDYPDALIFEEGKLTTFTVDFSTEFKRWESPDGVIKKIIPVKDINNEDKVVWLNVKNPLYAEVVTRGLKGQTKFKVLRSGQKKATRYTVVDE